MKILVITANAINFIGADTLSYFDLELGKQADCIYAGPGYPSHKAGEHTDETVRRLYGNDVPDWVYGSVDKRKKGYKTAGRIIDMHRQMDAKIERINEQNYNHMFFYYRYCKYGSQTRNLGEWTEIEPNYWWDRVTCGKSWLPWSYEPKIFYPSDEEPEYDVTLLGDVGFPVYPLRTTIYNELPKLCEENSWRCLLGIRVPGKFTLEEPSPRRKSVVLADPELRTRYKVGEDYAEALRRSRVFIFGTSIMKYPVKKWFEGMGSGACILADEPSMADELGFVDGHNYVKINKDNWKDKLQYVLENEKTRKNIARRAVKTAQSRHTHKVRVGEMLKILESHDDA